MKKVNIAFGTTVMRKGMAGSGIDGIGHYTKQLQDELSKDPSVNLIPFQFGRLKKNSNETKILTLPPFSIGSLSTLFFGQSFFNINEIIEEVDIVHATDHYIPKIKGFPVIATIMDAIPIIHPEWVKTNGLSQIKSHIWKKTIHFADHIITISEHSKIDLINTFKLNEKDITVIPLGVDERWFKKPTANEIASLRKKYALPAQFFLFVGTLQPRKNIERLIDAHGLLPASMRQAYPLLIIGRQGWQCEGILNRIASNGPAVRWLRYVPDQELVGIVGSAFALVFPSLHEGFGLPVLEGFAANVPVITSNATSLPEVAGDAALLIDPYDVTSIRDGLRNLIENPSLAQDMRLKGLERAFHFSWEKTSQATAKIYEKFSV